MVAFLWSWVFFQRLDAHARPQFYTALGPAKKAKRQVLLVKSFQIIMETERFQITKLQNILQAAFSDKLQCRLECESGFISQKPPLITCINGEYEKRVSLKVYCQEEKEFDRGLGLRIGIPVLWSFELPKTAHSLYEQKTLFIPDFWPKNDP